MYKEFLRFSLYSVAMLLALLPSVLKMYETSHWFKQDVKVWFENPMIPFQPLFDSSKKLMRVYFLIIPYFFSALFVALALMVPSARKKNGPSISQVGSRFKNSRQMAGSFLRVTLNLPSFVIKFGILPERISVGELLGIAALLLLNIMTMVGRVKRVLPLGSKKLIFLVDSDEAARTEAMDTYSWQACEVWAQTLGVIAILNLGWYLLMPISRKSVLLEALGLSWERAVKYHRWVAHYTVSVMILHAILNVMVWVYGHGHANFDPDGQMLQRSLVPWYCSMEECDQDQARRLRANMYGFTALTLILIIVVFSQPAYRRHRFELFYYVHHLFIMVLVFLCLHYKSTIIYIIPGIAIYAVDKIMALYSYHKTESVATRMLNSDVLEVSFNIRNGVKYQAGDYIFLNVPSVSHLQWHPFSLTSSPAAHGNKVFFAFKSSGSWTKQVIEEAQKQDNGLLRARLDGFYGVNGSVCDRLQEQDGVILVGGGIGITPMISLAMEVCKTNPLLPVTLMWVVRTIDDLSLFSEELVNAMHSNEHFEAKVWITMSGNPSKEKLLELESMEQVASVKQHLEITKLSQNPRDVTSHVFELDQPMLASSVNAFVMGVSILLATVGFALSAHIANKESFSDTIQDKVSLMDLSLVCVFVLVWIGIVILLRSVLARRKFKTSEENDQTMHETFKDNDLTEQTIPTDNTIAQTSPSLDFHKNDDVEKNNSEDKTVLLKSMIEGRIGIRPNIPDEFSSVSSAVVKSTGKVVVDISVFACGPPKLVESINNFVNAPTSCTSMGKKDNQAKFVFTEEDWEW